MADLLKQNWNLDALGDYYFVNQNNGLTPVFDFRSTGQTTGNPNAIFFGAKNEDAPSPDGSANIDWLELEHVSGELANAVYRVFTVLGQPPSRVSSSHDSCLSRLINIFLPCSVLPELLISLSSMPQNIVRVHVVMISAWPLLTGLFSVCLKTVGPEFQPERPVRAVFVPKHFSISL